MDKVEEEILNDFAKLYGEFNDINKEFVTLLPEEEASEDQLHWFNPKSANIEQFVHITETWIKGVREGTKEDHEEEACSSEVDDIRPEDSASRASHHTVASSTVSSARRRAAAEKVVLLARAASLKKKQALEEEEASLIQQQEKQLQRLKENN